jgi:cytidyltransferase-like protein
MYVGRWQPFHSGHRWLIDQRLNLGKNVLICIRNVPTDEHNPYTAEEVKTNIEHELRDLVDSHKVKVIIIPDIESINYGRRVGYDVIEHVPPEDISEISATKIRENRKRVKIRGEIYQQAVDVLDCIFCEYCDGCSSFGCCSPACKLTNECFGNKSVGTWCPFGDVPEDNKFMVEDV